MAAHSSVLPGESHGQEPGGLQSMEVTRVGHGLVTKLPHQRQRNRYSPLKPPEEAQPYTNCLWPSDTKFVLLTFGTVRK